MFPKITPTYLRLQVGALMARVQSERQAQTYLIDAMQVSAPQCGAVVSRLAVVADRPEGDWRLSLPSLDPHRRAAAPGRTADQPIAAAVAGGLARLSVEPCRIRP